MNPSVAIVIAAYNSEATIKEAVYSALNQTVQNVRVVIVDDASTDNTYNVLLELKKEDDRIEILKQEKNGGVYVARQRALEEIKTDYVAPLDADDIAMPNRVELY